MMTVAEAARRVSGRDAERHGSYECAAHGPGGDPGSGVHGHSWRRAPGAPTGTSVADPGRPEIDPAAAATAVDFGRLLGQLRRAAGLTTRAIDELTERAEIRLTRSKINKVEHGQLPELPWLRDFLNVCGVRTGTRRYREWERVWTTLDRQQAVRQSQVGPSQQEDHAEPVLRLVTQCLVRVECAGRQRSTGFFVAPGEVLTWWRDSHEPLTDLTVVWDGGSSAAVVQRLAGPRASVALLRLANPPMEHPCARWDLEPPRSDGSSDLLRLMAWSVDDHYGAFAAPAGAAVAFDGEIDIDGEPAFRLEQNEALVGLDGAPILNCRTNGVVGLLAVPAQRHPAMRAYGVPASTLARAWPDLMARNGAFHRRDPSWRKAAARESAMVDARTRDRSNLGLMRPLLELRADSEVSRADLLHPRYGVVPYVGRGSLLAGLMLWREHADRMRLLVLAGAGGFGKTRTAVELCLAAERAGWAAGMLGFLNDYQLSARIAALARWPGRVLVAVDYAETKPHVVAELLLALKHRESAAPVRVVLLVRQSGTQAALRDLFVDGDWGLELAGMVQSADIVRLDEDVAEVDRFELFEVASTAFAERLRVPPPTTTPALVADHFCRPLYVLAAALLATEDGDLSVDDLAGEELLLAILDRHEAEYWDRWNRRLDTRLTRDDQRRAVAWAALLGAETEAEALSVVRMLPGFEDATAERVRSVARWLASLYGAGRLDGRPAITPLEPDLLAEALVAREVAEHGPS